MGRRIGLIGGTGLYSVGQGEDIEVETPTMPVVLRRTTLGPHEVFFLPRHGASHQHVPLRVPHAAHIDALRSARCEYVVGVNNVGSLRADLRPGAWAVPRDFLDLHRVQRVTLHPDEPVHADFTEPYCPTLRRTLSQGLTDVEVVYVGVDGPRFETPAEVRWFASMGGDVVGMTGVPEAILAREAGLCYASICFVANHATGLGPPLDPKRLQARLAEQRPHLLARVRHALDALPRSKTCSCGDLNVSLKKRGGGGR